MKTLRTFTNLLCRASALSALLSCGGLVSDAGAQMAAGKEGPYKPTWNSLKNWRTPQWLRDGKFGIYTHWGVYSVPAQGPNCTW
jgi:alpha-L-fucosidase